MLWNIWCFGVYGIQVASRPKSLSGLICATEWIFKIVICIYITRTNYMVCLILLLGSQTLVLQNFGVSRLIGWGRWFIESRVGIQNILAVINLLAVLVRLVYLSECWSRAIRENTKQGTLSSCLVDPWLSLQGILPGMTSSSTTRYSSPWSWLLARRSSHRIL